MTMTMRRMMMIKHTHTHTHTQSYQLCSQQGERITTQIKPWYETHKCGYNNTHTQTAQPPGEHYSAPTASYCFLVKRGKRQGTIKELRRQTDICNVVQGDSRGNDDDDEKDDDDKTHTHTHKVTNYALNMVKESPHK